MIFQWYFENIWFCIKYITKTELVRNLLHDTVYVWEHIVSLYYRTAKWMFTKFGRDEMLMAVEGGGCPLQKSSSSNWKATATNQMVPFKKLFLQTGRLQQQTKFIAMI